MNKIEEIEKILCVMNDIIEQLTHRIDAIEDKISNDGEKAILRQSSKFDGYHSC